MRKHARKLITVIMILWAQIAGAQIFSDKFSSFKSQPLHYVCYKTSAPLQINGIGDEAAWQQALWTNRFQDIEGSAKPAPRQHTRVKMLWDATHLYILAEMEETDVWGTLRQHDTIIYNDNDFEVFIDPDGDSHQYYEIEVNALNTVMDLFMTKPYRNGGAAMINWDTKGLRTAVHVNGTLNNPTDKDRSWTVEMAIPFKALGAYRGRMTPEDGRTWRINFSRVHWEADVRNGGYVKRAGVPEYNWVWSPQEIINMHAPERWGYLQFSTAEAGSATVPFREPADAAARRVLWEVYYHQQQYLRQHRRYASEIGQLGIPAGAFNPVLEATSSQFTASIAAAGIITIINHEGKITSHHE